MLVTVAFTLSSLATSVPKAVSISARISPLLSAIIPESVALMAVRFAWISPRPVNMVAVSPSIAISIASQSANVVSQSVNIASQPANVELTKKPLREVPCCVTFASGMCLSASATRTYVPGDASIGI